MAEQPIRVLILGAYGFFGSRISEALTRNPRVKLLLAGRDESRATELAYQLGLTAAHAKRVDAEDPRLAPLLKKLGVNVLIHTAGPFQRQEYHVAQACIAAGCHYLDLADGRDFVANITRLDPAARAANVSVISGVSSLPALSAAVVDSYLDEFSRLDMIRIGISSGGFVPGLATMRAVFDYCGKPFRVLEKGQWIEVHGWLDRCTHNFPKPVGLRLFGRCDVPDLAVLPRRYPDVKTVSFHAGFASDSGHKLVEWLARQVQAGRIDSAAPFAKAFYFVARRTQSLLSDSGAMFVSLTGAGTDGAPKLLTWKLLASENHGPHIPCAPAIALINKLAAGYALPPGAQACMGMLSLEEILEPLKGLRIREVAAR